MIQTFANTRIAELGPWPQLDANLAAGLQNTALNTASDLFSFDDLALSIGISLAQTAEGALNEVTNMMQRVRELAVQSKSATYQESDRDYMNSEVQELQAQMEHQVHQEAVERQ